MFSVNRNKNKQYHKISDQIVEANEERGKKQKQKTGKTKKKTKKKKNAKCNETTERNKKKKNAQPSESCSDFPRMHRKKWQIKENVKTVIFNQFTSSVRLHSLKKWA